jgi:hypothetical protein
MVCAIFLILTGHGTTGIVTVWNVLMDSFALLLLYEHLPPGFVFAKVILEFLFFHRLVKG